MAKEITHGQGYDVEVGWGRSQECVSIATVMPEVPPNAGVPRDLPELIAAAPEGWATARGLYANLETRASVNKLIRDLQHARDAAFGKDA
jgi:hypothetical protein